ncbi:MAG: hypothetical protein R2912_10965 [Eubacteriales bacterium]
MRDWHAYDSAPLVDADTDTLIYPGENGILYTIKLNTVFDETTGQLSVNPSDVVKMRYVGTRSTYPNSTNTSNKYWLGYETSIATLGEFGYLGTNDGFLQLHQPQHDVPRLGAGYAGRHQRFARAGTGFCKPCCLPLHRFFAALCGGRGHEGSVPFMKVNAITRRSRLEAHGERKHQGSRFRWRTGDALLSCRAFPIW